MNKSIEEILNQLQFGTIMSDNKEPMLTNNRDIATQALRQLVNEAYQQGLKDGKDDQN